MPDLKKYWDEVRALSEGLPDYVWMMSLHNPAKGQVGGKISQVSSDVAARLLQAKSHRLATEEETQTHEEQQELGKRDAFRQRLQREGIAMVPVRAVKK